MFKIYDEWPEIARKAFETKFAKFDAKNIDHIVFAGMGGSGSIGDTINGFLSKQDIHVSIVKGYLLPNTVDANTLVVATSFSGNTEETLEILKSTKKTEANIIGFSSGGLLQKYCENNNIFFQNIPMVHSPRSSFTRFLYSILNVMEPILPIDNNGINDSILTLENTKKNIFSGNLTDDNDALSLAKFAKDIVAIYYPGGLKATAIRYKNSLQENTKIHAMIEDVIESCHNGVVSWEKKSNVNPVFIRGKDDHIKTAERWKILQEFFKDINVDYRIVDSVEGNILSKIINLFYLLDYSSIYGAVLNNTDPSPVNSIDFIKSKL
jgi:glucose/mannose-6-phosphate isomerase